jgi:hypothetical protein
MQFHTQMMLLAKKFGKNVASAKNVKSKNEDFIGIYEDRWLEKLKCLKKDKNLWFKSYALQN